MKDRILNNCKKYWYVIGILVIAFITTGFIVLKIARYGSEKVGIISVICYLLGTLFTPILTYYAFWGQSLTLMIAIQLAIGQFSNLFSLVFIAIGAMTAYITSKN